MAKKVAVLGAGSWGSVLASLLDENGSDVKLWSYNPTQVKELNEQHTNKRYIKDFTFAESLVATNDLSEAIDGVDYILFVVPTQVTRSVAKQVAKFWPIETKRLILSMLRKELKRRLIYGSLKCWLKKLPQVIVTRSRSFPGQVRLRMSLPMTLPW